MKWNYILILNNQKVQVVQAIDLVVQVTVP